MVNRRQIRNHQGKNRLLDLLLVVLLEDLFQEVQRGGVVSVIEGDHSHVIQKERPPYYGLLLREMRPLLDDFVKEDIQSSEVLFVVCENLLG